jgi:hypothetical protein
VTPTTFEELTGRNVVEVVGDLVGLPRGKALLDPEELGALLGWGRTKVYEELRAGTVPARKVGGRYVIPTPALLLWLLDVSPERAEQ